jgi:AcrR family transcriptional regulator
MAKKSSRSISVPERSTPLTRESISAAALQLIDLQGLDNLSMRRLGKELGVEAMAFYHHFKNKGELLDAVMERLLEEVSLPPRGKASPLQRLKVMCESYRQLAVKHPNAFILLSYRRFNSEQSFELYEQVLEAMDDLGLDDSLSARYFRMMGYYMNGAGLAEIASRATEPDATPVKLEDFQEGDRFPHVATVVPHLRVANLDAIYDYGMEMIFREMEASAAKSG